MTLDQATKKAIALSLTADYRDCVVHVRHDKEHDFYFLDCWYAWDEEVAGYMNGKQRY